MQNGKGTSRETELLAAADVASMIGVKETTVYRWCKEGKLACLKVGKHWRVRREALENFLRESERPRTLVGQLDSFLRVPDNVLAIAQTVLPSPPSSSMSRPSWSARVPPRGSSSALMSSLPSRFRRLASRSFRSKSASSSSSECSSPA
jgi:excisionase family DNA binding protein